MRRLGVKAGNTVAVTGIGGLGHLAVQFARALGASVTAVSASRDKKEDAMAMGAASFVYSKDEAEMNAVANRCAMVVVRVCIQFRFASFDYVFCTVSGGADATRYVPLLRSNGTLCLLGCVARAP